MDEGGKQHQLGAGAPGVINRQNHDEPRQRPQYSMAGVLHYLQHEWAKFEMERSQWELEKAELEVNLLHPSNLMNCHIINDMT